MNENCYPLPSYLLHYHGKVMCWKQPDNKTCMVRDWETKTVFKVMARRIWIAS